MRTRLFLFHLISLSPSLSVIARPGGRSIVRRRKARGASSRRRAVGVTVANTISSFFNDAATRFDCDAVAVLVNVVHVFLNHVHQVEQAMDRN